MTSINFGVEMQVSGMNIASIENQKWHARPNIDVHPLTKTLKVYADAETGIKNNKLSYSQIKLYRRYEKISTVYLSQQKEKLIFHVCPREDPFEYLFNDAEFISTYKEKETLSVLDAGSLLGFLVSKCIKSVSDVLEYLQTNTQSYHLEKACGGSGVGGHRPRTTEWAFKKVFYLTNEEPILFYTRDPEFDLARDIKFHFQTTIGTPVCDTWKVMVLLASEMIKIPGLDRKEKEDMQLVMDIHYSVKSRNTTDDKFISCFYPVLMYWIKTIDNRKKHGFILRHFVLDIIKHLSRDQLDVLCEQDKVIEGKRELLEGMYRREKIVKSGSETDENYKKRRSAQKKEEGVEYTTMFPVDFQAEETFLLIEFRYMNQLLNHKLRKNASDLLRHVGMGELKRIQKKTSLS